MKSLNPAEGAVEGKEGGNAARELEPLAPILDRLMCHLPEVAEAPGRTRAQRARANS